MRASFQKLNIVQVRNPFLLIALLPVIAVVLFFFGLLFVGALLIPKTSRKQREAFEATEAGGHFRIYSPRASDDLNPQAHTGASGGALFGDRPSQREVDRAKRKAAKIAGEKADIIDADFTPLT